MITVALIMAMVKVKSNENEIMKLMHFYITQMQRAVDASNINNHTNYAAPVRSAIIPYFFDISRFCLQL